MLWVERRGRDQFGDRHSLWETSIFHKFQFLVEDVLEVFLKRESTIEQSWTRSTVRCAWVERMRGTDTDGHGYVREDK